MLWSNNNCWLRSCSHNYQCIYCWNILAITKWSVSFQPDCYINSILSFKVNQLHLKETTKLTISQVSYTFCCYVWKQSNMVHEKFLLQYIVCADNLGNMSCCLVRQQSRLMCILVISITGICLTCLKSWTLPLYGFWLRLVRKCKYHHTDKKTGVSSSARWLCVFAPFITSDCGNHFLLAAISFHCWVDVTLSQSKKDVC